MRSNFTLYGVCGRNDNAYGNNLIVNVKLVAFNKKINRAVVPSSHRGVSSTMQEFHLSECKLTNS